MCDEKYIAPPWIKYPTFPEKSDFWRSGSAAEYLIKFNDNVSYMDKYLSIFPKAPTFVDDLVPSDSLSSETISFLEDSTRPLFVKLWSCDGKAKYDFNINEDKGSAIFMYDTILFDKSSHIHIGTKSFDSVDEIVSLLEGEYKEKYPILWDELKYTFYLNSLYYKILTDINFTLELIKTGSNPIIFKSSNLEWGVEEDNGVLHGKNLFGLAMMEIRDVVVDVYKNYDLIDWDISGEPFSKKRCMCGHAH